MKKSKWLVLLLSVFALFTFASCSGGGEEVDPTPETTKYTVTFNSNGGSLVQAATVEEGNKVTKPADPTRSGYTFAGWYTDSDLTKAYDFNTAVNESFTLYAKWTANPATTYTVTFDSDGGSKVDPKTVNAGEKVAKPTNPTKDGFTFAGWFTSDDKEYDFNSAVNSSFTLKAKWNPVEEEGFKATLKYNNGDPDGTIEAVKDGDDWFFDEPTKPTKLYHTFVCWCTDEELTKTYNFDTPVEKDITLYAKWDQAYDTVNTAFDMAAGMVDYGDSNHKTTGDTVFGRFTVAQGVYFQSKLGESATLNNQGKVISFSLTASNNNNAISFIGTGASSGKDSVVTVKNSAGETVYTVTIKNDNKWSDTHSVSNLPAGDYTISSDGSVVFKAITITEKLPQGPTKGISLNTNAVTKNYLLSRDFSNEGLGVILEYENGRTDLIALGDERLTITVPEDFKTKAGVKDISVTYKFGVVSYTETFKVNVCEAEELVIYDYSLDGSRVTQHLQTVFLKGSEFNADHLVVKAKCLLPGTEDKYVEFLLSSSEYKLHETPNLNTNENTISVQIDYKLGDITVNYDILVVSISATTKDNVQVIVAEQMDYLNNIAGSQMVAHTINEALQLIELYDQVVKLNSNALRMIALLSGVTYKEKVDIDMPNVVIASVTAEGKYIPEGDETITPATIEFNALSGLLDPSETTNYSTDGSATFSLRAGATGFIAYNVRFANYYNTHARYVESQAIVSDTQAVAVLVQADRVIFEHCFFSSYHDTLYAKKGRQYYLDCDIEGRTDYIFGDDATAYFQDSKIRSIGAGLTEKNGGYVVATKGNVSNGENIKYGYIFDNCDFIDDGKVQAGSVSIGRVWEVGMSIMVMNSRLGAHISKEAYGDKTSDLNDRYTTMSTSKNPNPKYLFEYNNEGAGALKAEDFTGDTYKETVSYATVEQAAKFKDLVEVFGPYNGTTKYSSAWAGDSIVPMGDNPESFGNKNPDLQKATVVIKNGSVSVATLSDVSYVGGYVVEAQLMAAIKDVTVPEGKLFDGFFKDSELGTKFNSLTDKLDAAEVELYIGWRNAAAVRDTFSVDDLDDDASIAKDSVLYDCDFYTVTLNAEEGQKGGAMAKTSNKETAVANDDSGLTFESALLPTGGGRALTFVAKESVTIIIYFTASNGDFGTSVTSKSGELKVNGSKVTSSGNKSSSVAYAYELSMTAGSTYVVTLDGGNRLVLFGIVTK